MTSVIKGTCGPVISGSTDKERGEKQDQHDADFKNSDHVGWLLQDHMLEPRCPQGGN